MHVIRLDVRENRLSSPHRITERDYHPYVAAGSAWVAERDGGVVGFAAAAGVDGHVWALFVSPQAEGAGIGRLLHKTLVDWAASRKIDRLTLTTAAGTRAEGFYEWLGWQWRGIDPDGSTRFICQIDQLHLKT